MLIIRIAKSWDIEDHQYFKTQIIFKYFRDFYEVTITIQTKTGSHRVVMSQWHKVIVSKLNFVL